VALGEGIGTWERGLALGEGIGGDWRGLGLALGEGIFRHFAAAGDCFAEVLKRKST